MSINFQITKMEKWVVHFSLIRCLNYCLLRSFSDFCAALPPECLRNSPECVDAIVTISSGNTREDDLIMVGEIQLEDGTQFSSVIREHLLSLVGNPMLSMLDLREEDLEPGGVDTVTMLVASAKFKNNPKVGVVGHAPCYLFLLCFPSPPPGDG